MDRIFFGVEQGPQIPRCGLQVGGVSRAVQELQTSLPGEPLIGVRVQENEFVDRERGEVSRVPRLHGDVSGQ